MWVGDRAANATGVANAVPWCTSRKKDRDRLLQMSTSEKLRVSENERLLNSDFVRFAYLGIAGNANPINAFGEMSNINFGL
jgi:hypothetical protein